MENNDSCSTIKECMEQVKKRVYVDDEILKKIISLLHTIKNKNFPSKKLPRGIILYGPPGTGKTLMMKTLKEVMDVPVVHIHGPEIMSEYYGKTEENLRRKFKAAQHMAKEGKLAIIFIDELDSIAPNRRDVSGELEQRMVGQLLTLMDGLSEESEANGHVMVIASTNRIEDIDPALRRPGRFDLEFEFDLPDKKGRIEILKILLQHVSYSMGLEKYIENIAENTSGFSGADLQHLINEAILSALMRERETVTTEDFKIVIPKIIPSGLRSYHLRDGFKSKDKKIVEEVERISNNMKGDIKDFAVVKVVAEGHRAYEWGYELASTLSCIIKSTKCRFIEIDALEFMVKWYGETERRIIEFFNKIKKQQPCLVYMSGMHVIASERHDKISSAKYAILKQLLEMSTTNSKIILVISVPKDEDKNIDKAINGFIEEHYEKFIVKL